MPDEIIVIPDNSEETDTSETDVALAAEVGAIGEQADNTEEDVAELEEAVEEIAEETETWQDQTNSQITYINERLGGLETRMDTLSSEIAMARWKLPTEETEPESESELVIEVPEPEAAPTQSKGQRVWKLSNLFG